jgi:adenylate cyclase class IV
MKFREVEAKYSAENITLTAFQAFCNGREPKVIKVVEAAGFDYFYSHPDNPDAFYRHRVGPDLNQLTFKRKTTQGNSNIRIERNTNLALSTSKEEVVALVGEHGYTFNTAIFKTCFVYFFDWYVLSYYVCYDKDLKELGRYMEIEANEEHDWATEQDAWNAVVVMEKLCKPLGLTPQMRIKRSLFELYRT